ncbi:MAG: thioesterase family protein [Candidatus Dormibacteraeota bacterium]|nr:thioesterase family protein [Candidatus Dormibacteraeota bacterium]
MAPSLAVTGALYTADGDSFVPSEHTRGPWDPAAQHAGPPAALLGRAFELLPSDGPSLVVRVTVDLLRPVPLQPLQVAAEVERPGRRTQLLRGTISAGGVELARARAVRMRRSSNRFSGGTGATEAPAPSASVPFEPADAGPAFHLTGVEMRFAAGSFEELGPSFVWIRLRVPLVEGEAPSPLQRALAAADFGNGVSAVLDWEHHLFINADLTVHLLRPPEGEWVALNARSWLDAGGTGLAHSVLHDTAGPCGLAVQSLLVDRRR